MKIDKMRTLLPLLLCLSMLFFLVACTKETVTPSSLPTDITSHSSQSASTSSDSNKEGFSSSNSSTSESTVVSAETTSTADAIKMVRPDGIPSDYEVTTTSLPVIDIKNWVTSTYEIKNQKITLTLPADIKVENNDVTGLLFSVDESSYLYDIFATRDGCIGGFWLFAEEIGTKVDETHYRVPEVGFEIDYYYNENFGENTFYYFGDYLVGVPYNSGYIPLEFENINENVSFSFFTSDSDSTQRNAIVQEIVQSLIIS